jgi:3-deoxy-D-manno-octulosonate 8-phosphate phosphatase (KDO 8-P phosphatase)
MALSKEIQKKLQHIKCFVLDVDGVLTDGTIGCLETGEMYRTFNVRDGYAIERATKAGYKFVIITGGSQLGVKKRLEYLKIKDIYMGSGGNSKESIYFTMLTELNITENELLYMGDDIPDYAIMKRPENLSACPADATNEIQSVSDIICIQKGGLGAVREMIELVLKSQNNWIVA